MKAAKNQKIVYDFSEKGKGHPWVSLGLNLMALLRNWRGWESILGSPHPIKGQKLLLFTLYLPFDIKKKKETFVKLG